jgi:hypothetical protein
MKANLNDLTITLDINKDMIYKHFFEINSDNKEPRKQTIKELKDENIILHQKIIDLISQMTSLDQKINIMTNHLELRSFNDEEKLAKCTSDYTNLRKKIQDKNLELERLKSELERMYSSKGVESCREIFVVNPTRYCLDQYLELEAMKEIIKKLNIKIEDGNRLKSQYEEELRIVENDVINYKKANNLPLDSPVEQKENPDSITLNTNEVFIDLERYNDLIKINKVSTDDDNDRMESDIYFPDKVQMKKVSQDETTMNKLDFNIIKGKYQSVDMIKVVKNPMKNSNNKIKDFDLNLNLNKKNYTDDNSKIVKQSECQIKIADEKLIELAKKLEKQKYQSKEFKFKINTLTENLKITDDKLKFLQKQIDEYCKLEDDEFEESVMSSVSFDSQ